jgi:ribosomal protein S18 acetylase RimI-like enzyme
VEVIAGVSTITIRPATPGDVSLAVEGLRLSIGDLADQVFGSVPGHSTQDVLAGFFTCRRGRFSYRYATVAEWDGQPAGFLVAYPSRRMPRLDLELGGLLLARFSVADILRSVWPLRAFARMREAGSGEYYISNLAVSPPFEGRGIASRLLAYVDDLARKLHLGKCSLLVDVHNDRARGLYERSGYRIRRTWKVKLPDGAFDGAHRMVKLLTTDHG